MVDVDQFVDDAIDEIAGEIGDANALIALSGGVDSSYASAAAVEESTPPERAMTAFSSSTADAISSIFSSTKESASTISRLDGRPGTTRPGRR